MRNITGLPSRGLWQVGHFVGPSRPEPISLQSKVGSGDPCRLLFCLGWSFRSFPTACDLGFLSLSVALLFSVPLWSPLCLWIALGAIQTPEAIGQRGIPPLWRSLLLTRSCKKSVIVLIGCTRAVWTRLWHSPQPWFLGRSSGARAALWSHHGTVKGCSQWFQDEHKGAAFPTAFSPVWKQEQRQECLCERVREPVLCARAHVWHL